MSDSPAPLADPHLVFDPVDGVRDVVILGSTGSIGTQAIDLVLRNPDRFRVTGLSAAGGRVGLLAEQAHRLRVRTVAVAREDVVPALREALSAQYGAGESLPEILVGADAATHLAGSECHTVLNGITGSIGLAPTLAALEAGRTLALANKESLIVGGPLVKALAKPGQIIPVDSEHAALFQALASGTRADVRKLVVTASGGPFRGRTKAELADVTPEDALAHPTWAMGPVITINSATLVNKGLEVIEAHWLYDVEYDAIQVIIHPQSVVHSAVQFLDGSLKAQLGSPDMRLPIQYALTFPERRASPALPADLLATGRLEFFPPDESRFPALRIARDAGTQGPRASVALIAADEIAVGRFLDGSLDFPGIARTLEAAVNRFGPAVGGDSPAPDLEEVIALDAEVRAVVSEPSFGGPR
jgi:1-deoxy-D-xylulose-5-phosphate reductoisomerase